LYKASGSSVLILFVWYPQANSSNLFSMKMTGYY
jgi:hypothetical protein